MTHPVGTLGAGRLADVDGHGRLRLAGARWSLDWLIGTEDRWRLPAAEAAVRQRLLDDMPVVETLLRVPGGDAVHRCYAARAGGTDVVVVEVANESPAPFTLALVVRDARHVDVGAESVRVDGWPSLVLPRPAARVAGGTDAVATVTAGAAPPGPELTVRRWRGGLQAAVVWPVLHRSSLRVLLPLDREARPGPVPPAAEVAAGWRAHLSAGPRATVPDPALQSSYDAARAVALLGGDDGAVRAVHHGLLRAVGDDAVVLLPDVPSHWLYAPVEAHDLDVGGGLASFALRWHGERPALLWEVPPGRTVSAPSLDPSWSSSEPAGEALLAPVTPATPVSLRPRSRS